MLTEKNAIALEALNRTIHERPCERQDLILDDVWAACADLGREDLVAIVDHYVGLLCTFQVAWKQKREQEVKA